MGTTPTYSWPYPEATDPVANGAQDIEDLALAVESTLSGIGKLLQVVSSYTQTSFQTSSGSYVDASLSATITPSSASSDILVILTAPYKIYRETSIVYSQAKVLRDSTDICGDIPLEIDGATASGRSANSSTFSFTKLDSPATTSATTYKLQTKVIYTANNAYVRWHANGSSLTLLEVSA